MTAVEETDDNGAEAGKAELEHDRDDDSPEL
jgi:hypothetical protein